MMSAGPGCGVGAPLLLVAVASVDGSKSAAGSVLQFSIGDGGVTPCGPTLTANHTLDSTPTAVAWLPPSSVAYGQSGVVTVLGSASDQLVWTYRAPKFGAVPLSIFPLADNGAANVGIAYDVDGYDEPQSLGLVDGAHGTQINFIDLTMSTAMPIGSDVQAMAADPRDATKLVYADDSSTPHPLVESAISWDNMTMVTPSVYYGTQPTGGRVNAMNTVRTGTTSRFAWNQLAVSTTSNDVIYEIDDDGSGPAPFGPLSCNLAACVQPFKAYDVAPDPSKAGRVLSICQAAMAGTALNNVRHVVRIDGATCAVLVDGTTLPSLSYPAALSVGASQ